MDYILSSSKVNRNPGLIVIGTQLELKFQRLKRREGVAFLCFLVGGHTFEYMCKILVYFTCCSQILSVCHKMFKGFLCSQSSSLKDVSGPDGLVVSTTLYQKIIRFFQSPA